MKIGLALGGGGAKGFAHIGVLRALEALGIYTDILVGTSMGGVIAGLYAAGLSVDGIEEVVHRTSMNVLAALERSNRGLFGKAKLRRLLHGVLGEVTFDQLPRKLAVMAVDLDGMCEVMLDSGPVLDALLVTSSFPGLFAPECRDGRYLIDGGALNNVPFDVARRLGADRVIACNVTEHCVPLFQPQTAQESGADTLVKTFMLRTGTAGIWEVIDRTIMIMQHQRFVDKLEKCPPDVMICPEVGSVALFEVNRVHECIDAGVAAVKAHEQELIALRDG